MIYQAGWRRMVSWVKESAAYANAAWMSACFSRGYASSRSASVASSPSLRKISSTGIRVPRMTGLPNMTYGLISIRSYFTQTGHAVPLSHTNLLLPSNSHYDLGQPPPGEGTRPTSPQNRPLVGRVPSPGGPMWSIMRIAGFFPQKPVTLSAIATLPGTSRWFCARCTQLQFQPPV